MDPKSKREALEPAADICWGRNEQCSSIARIPDDEGVAFLFGGPLTGKTTVLLRVYETLSKQTTDVGTTSMLVVPVYLTPKALAPMDSRGFCKVLLQAILDACSKQIRGFTPPSIGRDGLNILDLAAATDALSRLWPKFASRSFAFLTTVRNSPSSTPISSATFSGFYALDSPQYRSRISMAFTGGPECAPCSLIRSAPQGQLLLTSTPLGNQTSTPSSDIARLTARHPPR